MSVGLFLTGGNALDARVNTYRYSCREGLGIKDMIGGVLGSLGVEGLEEGLRKVELAHASGGLVEEQRQMMEFVIVGRGVPLGRGSIDLEGIPKQCCERSISVSGRLAAICRTLVSGSLVCPRQSMLSG